MVGLLAEWSDSKSNVKLGGFRSQLQASYVFSLTGELWYNETVLYIYLWPGQSDAPERSDSFRWQLWEEIA